MNTFDALMAEVNRQIAAANTAASQANAAAAQAMEAAENAGETQQAASAAAQAASAAAHQAQTAAKAWESMTVEAETAQAGGEAGVTLVEEENGQKLRFTLPRGEDGAPGEKGDAGRSGVTFTLSGTKLYITTG